MVRRGWFVVVAVTAVTVAACGSPNGPSPPPLVVGPATPPVVRSISVPASRVETGTDITITAVVEDAETPLSELTYLWTANVGTITGTGTTATWRHAAGLQKGADVVVTLMVKDTYDAIVSNQIVKQDFFVVSQAAPFRVHDSVAEVKELARKFLIDLFGNSSVSPDDCLVDFADVCADVPDGKQDEREDIVNHRRDYVVLSATLLQQTVESAGAVPGRVTSAVRYIDSYRGAPSKQTCTDFYLTTVYVGGRWWLCQSTISKDQPPAICGNAVNDGGVFKIFSGKGGV